MTRSIFVTATQRGSGKSTIALGLVSVLERTLSRVGYFKPICQRSESGVDPDVQLMKDALGLDQPLEQMEPITMDQVARALANGTLEELMDDVLDAFSKVEQNSDFVVCEGTDYFGAMASLEFDINARVAKDLGSPILLVANASPPLGGEDCSLDNVRMIKESFDDKNNDFFGVILNRVDPKRQSELRREAEQILARHNIRLLGAIPQTDMLEKPRIEEIAAALNAEVLSGKDRLNVIAHRVQIAAMTVENVLEQALVQSPRGALMLVPGDRDAILLGLAAAYTSPAVPAPAGVVITDDLDPGENVKNLVIDITGGRMPLLKVASKTYDTAIAINDVKPKLHAHQRTRVEIVKGLVERHIDIDPLLTQVAVGPTSHRVTPKQFLHHLIYLARRDRKHIVLPEGQDERILGAAERLIARKVVDLTLLGDEDAITKSIERLGIKLDGTRIINPLNSEWLEPFAERYVELRPPDKRPTKDIALDVMVDPTFFGTMMVHEGYADGMVSGAVNTTAATLRPALQFIKTKEGVSIASSVFFMCLPTGVLVYGDCAVNPNPTAEQLADIAIASAQTARAFDIAPYVAMLSYSTGDSGAGSDVEKVRQATKRVKERMPTLAVEGPIQYDAAVDPNVAKTKLPGSKVAGAATVFIFPDLNTGNVAYKAVQRSSGAIAVGPVMQGLKKPVNDLSRGCTVEDVVNTVAITAIQAQRG